MILQATCLRVLLVIALPILLVVESQAQSMAPSCVSQYLVQEKEAGRSFGIEPSEAEKLVAQVADSIGLQQSIKVIPCTYATKAEAWTAKQFDGVPDGEYVVYDPDWVREVVGSDRTQAIALFGHELGHFLNRHFAGRSNLPRIEKEKEADQFAGCAVARLGGRFSALENLLSRLRREKDLLYPDRLGSIESARKGFISCGGNIPSANTGADRSSGEEPVANQSDECKIFDCTKK